MAKNNNPGRILKGTKTAPTLKSASGVWTLDEALQLHRANAWPQPNLFQPIPNSLRLKKNSGTLPFITKTPGRPGNLLKWTVSAWVKLGAIGTASRMELFSAGDTASATTPANMSLMINWQGYSQDWHIAFLTGGGSYQIQTNMVLRDPSAWYHVVVVYDAAQSTNTNRVQIYINGVLASWSSTAPTGGAAAYTPQNLPLNWNNAGQIQRIGSGYDGGETYFLDGNIAEFYNIDGYALQPSLFGTTDTTGAWVPIPYTGSYGTNGFYLPFTNATTSQTLGYDASLTGTTTYNIDQDPYRGSVALHLTGNGPAGGQNNTFSDSSVNNYTVTRTSPATQGSFSPFYQDCTVPYNPAIHGGSVSSTYAGYISVPYQSGWLSGDSTIECWFYTTSQTYVGVWGQGVDLYGINLEWQEGADQKFALFVGTGAGWGTGNKSAAYPLNTWLHLAYVKTGNVHKLYVNGVLDINVTLAYTISGSTFYLGVAQLTTRPLAGAISSFAIYPGVQKYTAAFTPMMKPIGTKTNNQQPFSEDFTQSVYVKDRSSVVTGAAIAPDGTPTASKLVEDTTASNTHRWYFNQYTFTNAVSYTHSIYLKAGERTGAALGIWNGTTEIYCLVDLTNGSIAAGSSGTATVTSVGNGWYRCSVTHVGTGASGCGGTLYISNTSPPSGGNAYTGNGVSGLYMWGDQIEIASSMGNYTPTPANYSTAPGLLLNFANAAVVDSTGSQTLATNTNATISSASKYGQGALYFDGTASTFLSIPYSERFLIGGSNYTVEFWCNLSAYGEIIGAFNLTSPFPGWLVNVGNFSTAGKIAFFHANGSTNQTLTGNTTVPLNTWTHIAVVKQDNFLKFFINGQVDASFSLTITSTGSGQQINIGSDSNSVTAPGRRITGNLDDLRITKGVARYWDSFTPPVRALPEIGGKSFVTTNINAGVVKSFTATGTTSWTAPTDVTQVEILVVAGGGGGGGDQAGGGGGAGGVIYNNSYPVIPGQTYTVKVGAGGAGNGARGTNFDNYFYGVSGGDSQFGNLIALGGGGGASMVVNGGTPANSYANGRSGGSGGGGSNWQSTNTAAGGAGTPGQGFSGGSSTTNSGLGHLGGGGGGASGPASNATGSANSPTNGANGLVFGILGTPYYFAGGGAGGCYYVNAANGGLGGGGGGSSGGGSGGVAGTGGGSALNAGANGAGVTGGAGGANTGGGGGGAGNGTGGTGGSGIVLIRYTTTTVGNTSDSTTDNLVDSPTLYGHDMGMGGEVVGNYATWNPLIPSGVGAVGACTFSNGNLTVSQTTSSGGNTASSFVVSSGKWYYEAQPYGVTGASHLVGLIPLSVSLQGTQNIGNLRSGNPGYLYDFASTQSIIPSYTADGTIIGIAWDCDAGKCWFSINGAWILNGNPLAGTNPSFTFTAGTSVRPFVAFDNAAGNKIFHANFGQRAWAYNPPQGFNALTTKNLPRLTAGTPAANPNQYFDIALYAGSGATQAITLPGAFRPDLVWIRNRTNASGGMFLDSVRGTSVFLQTTNVNIDAVNSGDFVSFNSNGFSVGANGNLANQTSNNYAAWCWRAGGAAVANTAGTITSQVSANTTSGFSIVTWTGNGITSATVGHGLGAVPAMIICKERSGTDYWHVKHQSTASNTNLFLNVTNTSTSAASVGDGILADLSSSTTFGFATAGSPNNVIAVNENGITNVAYCWSEVPGFSKFGSWTNNNNNDGTFVYLGWKPAFIMLKNTDNVETWYITDSKRHTYNVGAGADSTFFVPNTATAEGAGSAGTATVDLLSNGFKIRTTNPASGEISFGTRTYIYMAFAEKPFGNVNGTAS